MKRRAGTRNTKRIVSVILALFLILTLFAGTTFATDETETTDIVCTHDCDDGTCEYLSTGVCDHECDEACGGLALIESGAPETDCTHDCADGICEFLSTGVCDHECDIYCGGLELDAPGGVASPEDLYQGDPFGAFDFGDFAGIMSTLGIMPFGIGDPSDLSNFITSVIMWDTSTTPPTQINSGDTVYTNTDYVFEIKFQEQSTFQFQYGTSPAGTANVLYYQLPPALAVQAAVPSTSILGPDNVAIGWYTISATGLVEVQFFDVLNDGSPTPGTNFIDNYMNAYFTLSITAQLTGDSGDTDLGLGDITINLQPPVPRISVVKTNDYVNTEERIYYTTTITAINGPATNIILMDAPTINGSPIYNNPTDNSAFVGFEYYLNTDPATTYPMNVTWIDLGGILGSRMIFTYDFGSLQLADGDSIIVTYFLDIPTLIENNPDLLPSGQNELQYNFNIGNQVSVSSDNGNDSSTVNENVSKTFNIKKTGKLDNDGESPPHYFITWEITIGDGLTTRLNSVSPNINTITDNLGGGIPLPAEADIDITFYNSNNAVSSGPFALSTYTYPYTYVDLPGYFELEMPPVDDSTYDNIFKVVITFDTPINAPPHLGQAPIHYDNNVTFTGPDGSYGSTGTVPLNPGSIQFAKTTSHIYCGNAIGLSGSDYYVDYTITANIPAGLYSQPLSINDVLALSSGILPANTNTPINLKVDAYDTVLMGEALPSIDYFVANNNNTWQMYFGTTIGPPPSGMVSWQYLDPIILTITYSIDVTGCLAGLQNGAVLTNTAQFQYGASSTPSGNTTTASSAVRDSWPITKVGTPNPNQPSLFDYVVTINGNNQTRYNFFPEGGEAEFTDTFNSLLEYVPGSFYVIDRDTGAKYVPSPDIIPVSPTLNVITADFTTLQPQSSGPPSWYTQAHTFDVYYQLQTVAEPDTIAADDPVYQNMLNEATVIRGACDFSNNGSVSYVKPKAVAKSMVSDPPGSNIVDVTIIINPEGHKYGVDPLIAHDTMTDLTPLLSTIIFSTQSNIGTSDRWDGVWVAQPTASDPNDWSYHVIDLNNLYFTIPDATPVMIKYKALVTTPVGETADISNTIEVDGVGEASDGNSFVVNDTQASAGGSRQFFTLYKLNENNEYLSGAEFDLYIAYLPSYDFYGPPPATRSLSVNGNDFYYLMSNTTVDGTALFSSGWITSSYKYLFLLVETKAPSGYWEPTGTEGYMFFTLPGVFSQSDINDLALIYGNIYTIGEFITFTNHIDKPPTPGLPDQPPAPGSPDQPPAPGSPGQGNNSGTGDYSNMLIWQLALLASALGLLCIMMWRWRDRRGYRKQ